MPVYSRRQLRRTLGQTHVRDTLVGTAVNQLNRGVALELIASGGADPGASGQGLYAGARLYHSGAEYRVASFNAASGAFVSLQSLHATLMPGDAWELHESLPPSDKDRALDEAVKRLRVRREVAVAGVAGALAYPVPAGVEQVLDGHYFTDPAGTGGRGYSPFGTFSVVETATGPEVRLAPAIGGSAQLLVDAITTLTLGAGDDATVNIPDERLVLFAAEAACWDLMVRRSPRGTAGEYRALRDEASRQYAALARNFKVPVDRPLRIA